MKYDGQRPGDFGLLALQDPPETCSMAPSGKLPTGACWHQHGLLLLPDAEGTLQLACHSVIVTSKEWGTAIWSSSISRLIRGGGRGNMKSTWGSMG